MPTITMSELHLTRQARARARSAAAFSSGCNTPVTRSDADQREYGECGQPPAVTTADADHLRPGRRNRPSSSPPTSTTVFVSVSVAVFRSRSPSCMVSVSIDAIVDVRRPRSTLIPATSRPRSTVPAVTSTAQRLERRHRRDARRARADGRRRCPRCRRPRSTAAPALTSVVSGPASTPALVVIDRAGAEVDAGARIRPAAPGPHPPSCRRTHPRAGAQVDAAPVSTAETGPASTAALVVTSTSPADIHVAARPASTETGPASTSALDVDVDAATADASTPAPASTATGPAADARTVCHIGRTAAALTVAPASTDTAQPRPPCCSPRRQRQPDGIGVDAAAPVDARIDSCAATLHRRRIAPTATGSSPSVRNGTSSMSRRHRRGCVPPWAAGVPVFQ